MSEQKLCFYHEECQGEGKHQCPKCKRWYCDECYEMFLGMAKLAGQWVTLPAPICPQCHYETFWVPAVEADRAR